MPASASAGMNTLPLPSAATQRLPRTYLPDHPSRLRQSENVAEMDGIHHGVSHQHLQAYLNEFTFRFNRRFYPFNAFRSLLGIAGDVSAPTFVELYSGEFLGAPYMLWVSVLTG